MLWPSHAGPGRMRDLRRLVEMLAQTEPAAAVGRVQDHHHHHLSESTSGALLYGMVPSLAAMVEPADRDVLAGVLQVVCNLQAHWGTSMSWMVRQELLAAQLVLVDRGGFLNAGQQVADRYLGQTTPTTGVRLLSDAMARIARALGEGGGGGSAPTMTQRQRRAWLRLLTGSGGMGTGERALSGDLRVREVLLRIRTWSRPATVVGPGMALEAGAWEAYISAPAGLGALRVVLFEWRRCAEAKDVLFLEALARAVLRSEEAAAAAHDRWDEDLGDLAKAVELDVVAPLGWRGGRGGGQKGGARGVQQQQQQMLLLREYIEGQLEYVGVEAWRVHGEGPSERPSWAYY
jgi:hypothetical protein